MIETTSDPLIKCSLTRFFFQRRPNKERFFNLDLRSKYMICFQRRKRSSLKLCHISGFVCGLTKEPAFVKPAPTQDFCRVKLASIFFCANKKLQRRSISRSQMACYSRGLRTMRIEVKDLPAYFYATIVQNATTR